MVIRAKTKMLFEGKPLTEKQKKNTELNLNEIRENKTILESYPRRLVFELTNACNLNCIMCGRNAADFPPESREIIEKDLAARYYCPQISEIYSIDEKMGSFYFDVSIDGFKKTFGVKDISRNIKMLDSGAVMLTDADGNRFIIPDINVLKPRTRRKIEPFLY